MRIREGRNYLQREDPGADEPAQEPVEIGLDLDSRTSEEGELQRSGQLSLERN